MNDVLEDSPDDLYRYHLLVMEEVENRGYKADEVWKDAHYRGKVVEPYELMTVTQVTSPIYPKHSDDDKLEYLKNLAKKVFFLKLD